MIILSSSKSHYRIPVVVPLPLPTPLATPPLAPRAEPVPVIPPLAIPLPLAPLLADGACTPPLALPLAGVLADGTLLYLLGGLEVVGGCSTKDVSVVRKVASTSGGACCVGMWRSVWCLELGDVKVLARAKDCGVGAWRHGVSMSLHTWLFLGVTCIILLGSPRKRRSCSGRRESRRSTR
jgi:hypothetical protein